MRRFIQHMAWILLRLSAHKWPEGYEIYPLREHWASNGPWDIVAVQDGLPIELYTVGTNRAGKTDSA